MKLSSGDESMLENWIIKQLSDLRSSNIDPDVMAKYTISLIKGKDASTESMRDYCVEELRPFLKDKTVAFTTTFFRALSDGSYKIEVNTAPRKRKVKENENDGRRGRSSRVRGRGRESESEASEASDSSPRSVENELMYDVSDNESSRLRNRRDRDVVPSPIMEAQPSQLPSAAQYGRRDVSRDRDRDRERDREREREREKDKDRERDNRDSASRRQHREDSRDRHHGGRPRSYSNSSNDRKQSVSHSTKKNSFTHREDPQGVNKDGDVDVDGGRKYSNWQPKPDFVRNNNFQPAFVNSVGPPPILPTMHSPNEMYGWGSRQSYPGNEAPFFDGSGGMGHPMMAMNSIGGMGMMSYPTSYPFYPRPVDQRNSYEDDLIMQNPRPPPPLPAGSRPIGSVAVTALDTSLKLPPPIPQSATGISSAVDHVKKPEQVPGELVQDQGTAQSSTHDFYQSLSNAAASASATAGGGVSLSGLYNPELDMTNEYIAAMNSSPHIMRVQQPPPYAQMQSYPIQMMVMHNLYNQPPQVQFNHQWKGHNHRSDHQQQQQLLQQLPESDRRTLKCTGIPSYITEDMIREHFGAFGHIVELQITPMSSQTQDAADPNKKVYNECLVQFLSAPNAKKCYNSPAPVLNNRFIKLFISHFNIKMPSDIRIPDYEAALERDRLLLVKEVNPTVPTAKPGLKRKKQLNIYVDGVASSKYRRTDENTSTGASNSAAGEPEKDSGEDSSNIEGAKTQVKPAASSEEQLQLKKKFEELKQLKQKAESILKQKEELLQAQVDKCRAMIEKLETSEIDESKQLLLQNLETKIVDLQTQLRAVRATKGDTGAPTPAVGESAALPAASPGDLPPSGRGKGGRTFNGRTGRGRGAASWYPQQSPPAGGRGAPGGDPQPSYPGGRYGRLSGGRWGGRGRFGGRTASSYYANSGGDEADGTEDNGIDKKISFGDAVQADSVTYPVGNGMHDNSNSNSAARMEFECDSSSADEYEPDESNTSLSATS